MSIYFSPIKGIFTPTSSDICAICKEPLTSSEVVVHNGPNGGKHPLHKACIRTWVKINPTCPVCNQIVDPRSLLSCTENAVSVIKSRKKVVALVTGAIALPGVSAAIGATLAAIRAGAAAAAIGAGGAAVGAVALEGTVGMLIGVFAIYRRYHPHPNQIHPVANQLV